MLNIVPQSKLKYYSFKNKRNFPRGPNLKSSTSSWENLLKMLFLLWLSSGPKDFLPLDVYPWHRKEMLMALERLLRVNHLYSFYKDLLTERQRQMLHLYYERDYSLAEVAQACSVSRQAVHNNLQRAATLMEEYEEKLQLVALSNQRQHLYDQLRKADSQESAQRIIDQLQALDN